MQFWKLTHKKSPTEFTYDLRPTSEKSASIKKSDSVIDLISSSVAAGSAELKHVRWGYQIRSGENRIRCIKLFLDRGQKLPPFVDEMGLALELKKTGRSVIDAVSDFLTKVHNHVLEVITRRCGEALAKTKILKYVLTVPAIWSDVAKDATKEAAYRAGIKKEAITMISEPEAAAIYALHDEHHCLTTGSNFIICDAGGGTVDLISYKITSLAPLAVEENSVGTGGICGAALLNYAFQDELRALLGESVYADWRVKYAFALEHASNYFEDYVKREFSNGEVVDFYVPFPGAPDHEAAGIQAGHLTLTHAQVEKIFEPVVDQILSLLQNQINAVHAKNVSVSSIILVGGFGQSRYLYECIKTRFGGGDSIPSKQSTALVVQGQGSALQERIEIIQPTNAWSAVARGAALRGAQGSVATSRRSRYHYGTTCDPPWDESKHPRSSRWFDHLDGSFRARATMNWYLDKGEAVTALRAIPLSLSEYLDKYTYKDPTSRISSYTLYACAEDVAPVMFSETLQEVCTVTADLTGVPDRYFKKKLSPDGEQYRKLKYNLEMTIDSAEISFAVKVDGRSYGVAEAVFNH